MSSSVRAKASNGVNGTGYGFSQQKPLSSSHTLRSSDSAQTWSSPPMPHSDGPSHGPHTKVEPQPSWISPQVASSCAQVSGTQPHTFACWAPHSQPGWSQVPHSSGSPQPSVAAPQSKPWSSQVRGTHGPPPSSSPSKSTQQPDW